MSWEANKKSIAGVVTLIAILIAVNVFQGGMIGGAIAGGGTAALMALLIKNKKQKTKV